MIREGNEASPQQVNLVHEPFYTSSVKAINAKNRVSVSNLDATVPIQELSLVVEKGISPPLAIEKVTLVPPVTSLVKQLDGAIVSDNMEAC
ncbi:hypothetical protein ACH5RR_015613 [Cinchona calisaya]|uniref:Uncharacterized protein n=1 Tax=Cinchona calisaya TaxID=153742 RepID=A0ABD2ZTP5_9GENT